VSILTRLDISKVLIGFRVLLRLKGHFSRLAHQQSKFHASVPPQILADLTLRLPPTAHSPYYYDTIGNVSTSHFRQGSTPASQQLRSTKVRTSPRLVDGVLELRPRYPLLGGWNYSFVIGYDMPLEDVVKVDQAGKMVLGVPFLAGWRDLLVEDVELTIILPEGAR
jgi:oligosaccharyltransferase complex subunit alpha (ribophorin I)